MLSEKYLCKVFSQGPGFRYYIIQLDGRRNILNTYFEDEIFQKRSFFITNFVTLKKFRSSRHGAVVNESD